jgi:hypothetical protein
MSYCRWSSEHFECDVYVYANVSGAWTTHVAGRRLKHRVPDELKAAFPNRGDSDYGAKFMAAYRAVEAWRSSLPCDEYPVNYAQADGTTKPGVWRVPKDSEWIHLDSIGPEAGQSFDDACPGECADRLEVLRAKGFNVPQYAIDGLREDQREIDQIRREPVQESHDL